MESNPGPVTSGIEVEKTFKIDDQDPKAIHYFRQLGEDSDQQLFRSPWGGCVIKNCNEDGDLVEFSSIVDYEKFLKTNRKQMWLYLNLKVFKFNGLELFGVFVCPECDSMAAIEELQASQEPENIRSRLCLHSCVASMMIGDWRRQWTVGLSPSDLLFNVIPNQETNYVTFIQQSSDSSFLAAVLYKSRVSLLYCATKRQEQPFCSNCVRRKCHHYTKLLSFEKNASQGADGTEVNLEEDELGDYEPLPDTEEEEFEFNNHYMKTPPNHIRGYLYGYNFKPIIYPFCDSPVQQQVWLERMAGIVNIPSRLVPVFEVENKCKHNAPYNENEEALIRESPNVCLFNEIGQRNFPAEVFARPSVGPCKCVQKVDGHDLMIWNVGKGRFVDYTLLHSYLHKWRASGISMYALYRSIVDGAESCGITCSITYPDIHRAVCGFFCNLVFDVQKAFSCPTHGNSPRWIVADGKALGPLKRRVKQFEEFDVAADDSSVLAQSTHFKDRIFVNLKKERDAIRKLVTGEMSMQEFRLSGDIITENGLMVINAVAHIEEKFTLEIPEPYIALLSNISKNSSCRSLMQVTNLEHLEVLALYCKEELDLRITENEDKMKAIIKTFPALWPILDSVCTLENTKFLPKQVSKIILKMLTIRFQTFQNATKRSNSDYYLWPDPSLEHPT